MAHECLLKNVTEPCTCLRVAMQCFELLAWLRILQGYAAGKARFARRCDAYGVVCGQRRIIHGEEWRKGFG